MIEFICAVYNEQDEIPDLITHIYPYVDRLNFVDDGSTDATANYLEAYQNTPKVFFKTIEHTGLCEVARIHALDMCESDSWVIMLDADERFDSRTLNLLAEFLEHPPEGITHVYFRQIELIDGVPIAEFAKVKVFKKSAATLPEVIHRDPQFTGEAVNFGGTVIHRKTSGKQVMRERQYLDTYDRLLAEGKVTEGDVQWFTSMHHYIKSK